MIYPGNKREDLCQGNPEKLGFLAWILHANDVKELQSLDGWITEINLFTVFENHRKSLIEHCERSELCLQKFIKNAKNSQFWPEACSQPVLQDRSLLIGQKLVQNAKIEKFK